MKFLESLLLDYRTTVFGAVAAGAGWIASLHGPHFQVWASIAALALALTGAAAKDGGTEK